MGSGSRGFGPSACVDSVTTVLLKVYHDNVIQACVAINHDISILQNRYSQSYLLADHLFRYKPMTLSAVTFPSVLRDLPNVRHLLCDTEVHTGCGDAQTTHFSD